MFFRIRRQQYMKSRSNEIKGMTLVEVMIYSVLLSFLLSGFIRYAYDTYFNDINTANNILDAYAQ